MDGFFNRQLIPLQCRGDQLPQSGEEIRAHARMKAISIYAANRKKTEFRSGAKRHQGARADFIGFAAEQKIALCVADLAATRIMPFQKRVKRLY